MAEKVTSNEAHSIFNRQTEFRRQLRGEGSNERRERLSRLDSAIRSHVAEIDLALQSDLRKMPLGLNAPEVAAPLHDIATAQMEIEQWMMPHEIEPSPQFSGNRAYIQYEPRGICLLFGAWNFPFGLVMQPLVAILAAGNSAIVKPNELAPATSSVIAKILRVAFDEREVAVVEGGVDVADSLLELPVDHVFFTGSTAVGRHVMAAASRHLSTVTLELGGKCPVILDTGVDLQKAARKVAGARYYNAGQLCLSADHVWLMKEQREEFLEHLHAATLEMFYADGKIVKARLSRMVNLRNYTRVMRYLHEAVASGAKIAFGGQGDEADLTIHPTALTDVPLDASIMREEIFGPVLPILEYTELAEVLHSIERQGKPLALYLFSNRQEFIEQVLRQSSSGGVTVNDVMTHAAESRLPFGGVNQSGIGRYKGIHGFHEMSNPKSVFIRPAG